MADKASDKLRKKTTTSDPKTTRRSGDNSEFAYNALHKLLVEFQLKPDSRLNEVQLSRSLGMSRTPVREALNRLASEGFVSVTPNRGFFVRSLSTEGMLDLYELRCILECAAFRLLCERAEDSEIERLAAYWQSIQNEYRNHPPDLILAEDEAFHLLIAEICGNMEIVERLEAINARIRFIRRIQIEHPSHSKAQVDFHTMIVEAALKRDAESGVKFLREHIEMTVASTQQALKDALLRVYTSDSEAKPRRRRQTTAA